MKRPLFAIVLGVFVLVTDVALRPWADHVGVVAGMPIDASSWTIGPLLVVLRLAAALAPILILAGAADALLLFRRARV